MSNNIQLTAGALSVSVMSDEADLSEVSNCAHQELKWLMESWTEAGGSAVRVRGSDGFEFGGR